MTVPTTNLNSQHSEKERLMSTATLDLPRIHPLTRNVSIFLRETRYEFLRLMRTRSFSFSVVGFPVVFYIFLGIIMNRGQKICAI